jgi:hypothetical protein
MLLWNPHTLTFSFEVPEMPKSEGVQKILGFSRGWHHWNSVRLGIRKENDYCVLYLYAYVRGERIVKRMETRYKQGETVWCRLTLTPIRMYVTTVMEEVWCSVPMGYSPCKLGYLLFPYFETDAPENKVMPFKVEIWDVRVNGKDV